MGENAKLLNILDLHRAFYYSVANPLKLEMPNLWVKGYESSRTQEPLPPFALAIILSDIQVDRNRPTPQIGHRIFIPGELKDYEIDGEIFQDVPSEYVTSQPLPMLLTYHLHTSCHSASEQIQLDHALLKLLPERGVLNLEIDTVEYEIPIELLGIQNLDDLRENLRERLYRFSMEVWIQGVQPDDLSKIITNFGIEAYQDPEPLLQAMEFKATTQ